MGGGELEFLLVAIFFFTSTSNNSIWLWTSDKLLFMFRWRMEISYFVVFVHWSVYHFLVYSFKIFLINSVNNFFCQKAVSAWFTSKQILPFSLAEQGCGGSLETITPAAVSMGTIPYVFVHGLEIYRHWHNAWEFNQLLITPFSTDIDLSAWPLKPESAEIFV